jgi:hypothetical protein
MKSKLLFGVAGGVVATMAMDVANRLGMLTGLVRPLNLELVGKLLNAWWHGKFFFSHPGALAPLHNAAAWGRCWHYLAGIVFALLFSAVWQRSAPVRKNCMPSAAVFGLLCSLVSLCLILPSLGLGFFGLATGTQALSDSLYNHLVYGLALGAWYRHEAYPPKKTG